MMRGQTKFKVHEKFSKRVGFGFTLVSE